MQEYLVFHPSYIVSKMREGIYFRKAFNFRCVPNIRNKEHPRPKGGWLVAKKKGCTTLGKLFTPKKFKGSQIGLRTISEKDRFKGKIDWGSERQQITNWLSDGWSLWKIAKQLNISPSTLSEANKRYSLYDPRKSVREQIRNSA